MEYLLSIDAGTTSFKGALFDRNGSLKASSSYSYDLIITNGNFIECTTDDYIQALKSIISDLLELSGVSSSDILAMAIDSQGETLIAIDENGDAIGNAIVWLDSRATREASIIARVFGVETVYEHTGQPDVTATWPACKILWLRGNKPELFKKVHCYMLLEDYLIYKLTGCYAAERSLLTSTIFYDVNTGGWWYEMLDFIGIKDSQLPKIHDSAYAVSNVTKEASDKFGLSQGTQVVTGALDQLAGMIGAGGLKKGIVTETTGTCLAMCAMVPKLPDFNPLYQIPCHTGIQKGDFYQIYWSQTAGAVLEWFKNNFYSNEEDVFGILNDEAKVIAAGSDGVTVLPHLSGKACPEFNPNARGMIYGLNLKHTRGHITRAIMESIAYMLREHIETAQKNNIFFDEVRALGGGSNSSLWNQIKADVTNKRIVTMSNPEITCLGTAILAGTGTGLYDDIANTAEKMLNTGMIFKPNPEKKEIYINGYNKYRTMYEKIKETF